MLPLGGLAPPVLQVQSPGCSSLDEPWNPESRLSSTTIVGVTLSQSRLAPVWTKLPSCSNPPSVPEFTTTARAGPLKAIVDATGARAPSVVNPFRRWWNFARRIIHVRSLGRGRVHDWLPAAAHAT